MMNADARMMMMGNGRDVMMTMEMEKTTRERTGPGERRGGGEDVAGHVLWQQQQQQQKKKPQTRSTARCLQHGHGHWHWHWH
jgi:hypothetical protein